MVRTLPGVEIKVVYEIVPQQLNPSGVVAMIGTTMKLPKEGKLLEPTPVSSWAEFLDKFGGDGENFTVAEDAKQAFQNGVYQVVVVPINGIGGTKAGLVLNDRRGKEALLLEARLPGEAGNSIAVRVADDTIENYVVLEIGDEKYSGSMNPADDKYLVKQVNDKSSLVTATERKTAKTYTPNNNLAVLDTTSMQGGAKGEANTGEYEAALENLTAEPDVDIVLACGNADKAVHKAIEAHCRTMSEQAKNRIGIGSVAKDEGIKDICGRNMGSERFILVAPHGCVGAVAGLLSRLNYFESPTYKPVSGIAKLERKYTPAEQIELLKAGVLPLEEQRGRGIVVVKGVTTNTQNPSNVQISVMRISDHAVRGVKSVADLFIGTLNSPDGRSALKGKVTEFLTRMTQEGALVPSTDGKEPPFKVDVYSSELDFAQGIVNVNIAVRPVRAMDYIYGTIKVEV